jgi:hypothetical protein
MVFLFKNAGLYTIIEIKEYIPEFWIYFCFKFSRMYSNVYILNFNIFHILQWDTAFIYPLTVSEESSSLILDLLFILFAESSSSLRSFARFL